MFTIDNLSPEFVNHQEDVVTRPHRDTAGQIVHKYDFHIGLCKGDWTMGQVQEHNSIADISYLSPGAKRHF